MLYNVTSIAYNQYTDLPSLKHINTSILLLQRYIVENQETCARVAVRESGKTLLDALIGEVLVTCEKLSWLANSGAQYLQVRLSLSIVETLEGLPMS